jgi:hypothetical protein
MVYGHPKDHRNDHSEVNSRDITGMAQRCPETNGTIERGSQGIVRESRCCVHLNCWPVSEDTSRGISRQSTFRHPNRTPPSAVPASCAGETGEAWRREEAEDEGVRRGGGAMARRALANHRRLSLPWSV